MDIKQSNNSQTVNWEHFPGKNLLVQFLTRNNMIELNINDELHHSGVYDKLISILKDDLGDKLKLVRKFIFKDVFCFRIAGDVFNLLPNVNNIEFSSPYCGSCGHTSLTFINSRQNLEHITFQIYYKSYDSFDKDGVIFSKSLKSLKINEEEVYYDKIPYFDSIDSSYTNLITLDITTNKMLRNLISTMPNLENVGIIDNEKLEQSLILDFIKKNPQLKKLELRQWPFDKLVQEVLSFKSLSYLSIFGTSYYLLVDSAYLANYSIKKLALVSDIHGNKAIKLINACRILEILDISGWGYYELEETEWNKLDQSIKTIEMVYFDHYRFLMEENIIQSLDTLQFFDKAIIKLSYDEDQDIKELKELNFPTLKNYKLYSPIGTVIFLLL